MPKSFIKLGCPMERTNSKSIRGPHTHTHTPIYIRVCGWGRGWGDSFYVCFYVCFHGNRPLEPRLPSQKLRFCVWRGFCEIYLTHPATGVCVCWGEAPTSGLDVFYVCFLRKSPVRAEVFDPEAHICLCRDLGEMCLTYQAT